jgi:hypothetical protein
MENKKYSDMKNNYRGDTIMGNNAEDTTHEPASEATAIKLVGMALEKVEKEVLWKMGGQVGCFNPTIEVGTGPHGMIAVRASLLFDRDVLQEVFGTTE